MWWLVALSNTFFFNLHRWLRPSRPTVPGVFRARGVWGPCDCFGLGEPSVVQQVRHQSEGVSLWWKRRLHHSRGCGSRRPGNWRHHLHPHLHHHTPQWVSTVCITFTHWYLTSPTPTYIYCIQYKKFELPVIDFDLTFCQKSSFQGAFIKLSPDCNTTTWAVVCIMD